MAQVCPVGTGQQRSIAAACAQYVPKFRDGSAHRRSADGRPSKSTQQLSSATGIWSAPAPTAVRWILARPPAPRLRTVSALKRKGGQNADSGPLQRLGSRCTRACRSAGSGRLADGHSVRPLVMASPNDLLRADRKYFPRRPRVSLASVTPVADILRQPVCRRRESGSGEPFGLLSTGPAARGSG